MHIQHIQFIVRRYIKYVRIHRHHKENVFLQLTKKYVIGLYRCTLLCRCRYLAIFIKFAAIKVFF